MGVTMDPVTSVEDRVDLRDGVPGTLLSSSSSFLLGVTFFGFGTDTDDKTRITTKPTRAIYESFSRGDTRLYIYIYIHVRIRQTSH